MELGTATAGRGERATGWLSVTSLPTGGEERLPVAIVEGESDGPTLWVTASIHGDEITGLAAAQDLLDEVEAAELAGTLVCLPNLNPAGLRRNERTSYYGNDDPNRYFPDGEHGDDERVRPPETQERIDRQIYDRITDSADAVVCLHTAGIRSRPFTIRGRVPYGTERDQSRAEEIAATLDDLVTAFGVPVVNQYEQAAYDDRGLNRSLAGALRDLAGIPAFTPELGSHSVVEDEHRRAAVTGMQNVLRTMEMLPGDPRPNEAAPPDPVDFPVRRHRGPHVEAAGVVRYAVEAGDTVQPGTEIAEITTPHGGVEATVEASNEGYVLGRSEGGVVYEGQSLCSLAVRDEGDLVVRTDGEE